MFNFNRLGVYSSKFHPNNMPFIKITHIGNEPISFLDNAYIDNNFKKINVIVLIQSGNSVFLDEDKLPHATLIESDLQDVVGVKTNDSILKETAKRAAYNAGTTIQYGSLSLIGKVENDEVYYVYFGTAGTPFRKNVKTTPLASLTKESFLNQCTLAEIRS